MKELSLDVALDILGKIRMMKVKQATASNDEAEKESLLFEAKELLREEQILYREQDTESKVMNKVLEVYSPLLKSHYTGI